MKRILILVLMITINLFAQFGRQQYFQKLGNDSLGLAYGFSKLKVDSMIYIKDGGLRYFNGQFQFSNNLVNWFSIPTSLPTGGGWTLGLNKIYQSTAGNSVHIRLNAGDTTGTQLFNVYGNIQLVNTISSGGTPYGIIYKGSTPFIHNFNYGNNGTVTTSGHNIFIGLNAGNFTMGSTATSSSEASDNLGIGSFVLQNNTIGYFNIGLGSSALRNNTTGYYNFAGGINALINNTIGFHNVAIGANAGRFISNGSTPLTNPSYSIFIGTNTKALNDSSSNEIVIGYNATGNGSNSATYGNSSITKHIFPSGNAGFRTSNPTAIVDINGTTGYNQLRLRTSYTPTSSSDPNGNVGDITWDNDYIYVKTSLGWRRAPLSSF